MKWTSFILMGFLAFPWTSSAAYLVVLANGNALVVSDYWEELQEIRFFSDGGTVGVPKGTVKEIRPYEQAPQPQQNHRKPTVSSPTPPAEVHGIRIGTPLKRDQGRHGLYSRKEMEQRKAELEAELDRHIQQFRRAARSRDMEAKKKAMDDMTKASTRLVEISDRLGERKEQHASDPPDRSGS